MSIEDQPNWSQLFLSGLQGELRGIKDSLTRIDTKVDNVHAEQRITNGRVTKAEADIKILHERREEDEVRREREAVTSRTRVQAFSGPLIGAGATVAIVVLAEVVKHVS